MKFDLDLKLSAGCSPVRTAGSYRRAAQAGVALVITLVMVSIIAFLAVAFLILTARERGAVTVASDQTDARLAAETAAERATAELLAPMLAYNDLDRYDLSVSTNYINRSGFYTGGAGFTSPTNVNYDYVNTGGALSLGQRDQNINNLLYNPRAPVFVVTNKQTGAGEFRFYLDLNRNGKYEPSGYLPVVSPNGRYYNSNGTEAGFVVTNAAPPTNVVYQYLSGDPEWIGVLERPEYPHSSSNKFISRYAYQVVPDGKALDANFIHNYAKAISGSMAAGTDDGFLRNQGVGSWEINLGAFLTDLNTNANVWPINQYSYALSGNSAIASGIAYDDALSFLRHRYNGSPLNLTTPFLPTANDNPAVDEATTGPLMTGTSISGDVNDHNVTGYSGAKNPNGFFTPQDFFDGNKTSPQFTNRLMSAGLGNSTYDSYTFYRMLAQLGTESSADDKRLNLNYVNVDNAGNIVPDMETNFIPWQPLQFFTNAANRLLATLPASAYGRLSITNIPIYPTNQYTPAVHRLLQVAANLYDAANTNGATLNGNPVNLFPSIFRPQFRTDGSNVYIAGYTNVDSSGPAKEGCVDVSLVAGFTPNVIYTTNVYSAPWIVGAKKGFPNFNEFTMQTASQVTRKLSFDFTTVPRQTNQMYLLGITNTFGVEAWNAYSNAYPRRLNLLVTNEVTSVIVTSNGLQEIIISSNRFTVSQTNAPLLAASQWKGIRFEPAFQTKWPQSFIVPINTNRALLQPSAYLGKIASANNNGGFTTNIGDNSAGWTNRYPVPQWWLRVTNRMRFILVDVDANPNRVVDYASFNDLVQNIDLTGALMGAVAVGDEASIHGRMWQTNRVGGNNNNEAAFTYGIMNQLGVSDGSIQVDDAVWNDYGGQGARLKAIARFRKNMGLSPDTRYPDSGYPVLTRFDAPYQPTRTVYVRTTWQANDPLVHYTATDLLDLTPGNQNSVVQYLTPPTKTPPQLTDYLGKPNSKRYEPWPNPNLLTVGNSESPTKLDLTLKDPLISRADDWQFPTNPLPNVGWIGQVHRGTPWQTLYLKSTAITNLEGWKIWTGNAVDPLTTSPTNDWQIADLFTAVLTDNAERGRLSVNQTNLAAWSAVLSGVLVLSNEVTDAEWSEYPQQPPRFLALPIEPAGALGKAAAVGRIVEAINTTRAGTNYYGTFPRVGDILSVPELTVNSPFLNTNAVQRELGLTDAAYERIPQQVLGLLRHDDKPRFTVYAYGQALKPADRSIVASGPQAGLCTNYQITAEVAIRSVVRLEGGTTNTHAVVESYNYLPPD